MQYRTLGKTGWNVSTIGFGAWGIAGQWGPVEHQEAIDAYAAAIDAGMNFFDTADAYGNPPGLSEQITGEALRGKRDQVYIATKVGNWARRAGHSYSYDSPLHIINCCHASLHRLGVDTIDLYQCHIANLDEPDIFLEAFEQLKKDGKIRAYGISTDNVEVLKRFNRDGTCAACQLDYSLLNRKPERELLPYCQQHNIGTIIRGPLARGVATGKFTRDTTFNDSIRQGWNDGDGRASFLQMVDTVEQLSFLAADGRTMPHAALQFVLAHPAVSVAIPGAKSPAQARTNAAAADGQLQPDELARVSEVVPV